MQSTRYVFTINNYTQEDVLQAQSLTNHGATLVVFGYEAAPQTGTKHIQGYVEFTQRKRRTAVAKLLPRAFLDKARGDQDQNIGYCTKGGDFYISDLDLATALSFSKNKQFNDFYSNEYKSQYKIRLDFYYNNEFFNNDWNKCLEYHENRDTWYLKNTKKIYHNLPSNE